MNISGTPEVDVNVYGHIYVEDVYLAAGYTYSILDKLDSEKINADNFLDLKAKFTLYKIASSNSGNTYMKVGESETYDGSYNYYKLMNDSTVELEINKPYFPIRYSGISKSGDGITYNAVDDYTTSTFLKAFETTKNSTRKGKVWKYRDSVDDHTSIEIKLNHRLLFTDFEDSSDESTSIGWNFFKNNVSMKDAFGIMDSPVTWEW